MKALIEVSKNIIHESTMYPICPECGHQIAPCEIPDIDQWTAECTDEIPNIDQWTAECTDCGAKYFAIKITSYTTELIKEDLQ